MVPNQKLHLTSSTQHAQEVLQRCVEDEVETIFAGGGDGTIVNVINALHRFKTQQAPVIPNVGILKLGTGNALARWLGSKSPIGDLRRWAGGKIHRVIALDMVETEGLLSPFAGIGQDAAILNDYNRLLSATKGTIAHRLLTGIGGYMVAGTYRAIRDQRRTPNIIEVINLGPPAHAISRDGIPMGRPIPTGGVIYEGPATFAAAATTPLYGYGIRMFPYATRRQGMFQLRIANTSPFDVAVNLPKLWRGTIVHPKIFDFYAQRVRIRCDNAMPLQLAGDACGHRREVTLRLKRRPIRMVGRA